MPSSPAPAQPYRQPIGIAWYAVALVAYVVSAYFFKAVVMNWILGPLFLLITLYLLPVALSRLYVKLRSRSVG